MHVIHDAVPEGIYSGIHEPDADPNVVLRCTQGESFQQEHGAANDSEICSDRGMLEVVPWKEPFNNGSEEISAAVNNLLHVTLVGWAKAAQSRKR